jgi:hypothetical protein
VTEGHSAQSISVLLDELVDAWEDLHAGLGQQTFEPPPQPPASFEDVQSLADYNQRRARWLRGREEVRNVGAGINRTFEQASERVRAILPRNTSITHVYQGDAAERAGRYLIAHSHGSIEIERLDNADDR